MPFARRRLALVLLAGLALVGCKGSADAAGGANGSGSGVFTGAEYVMGDPKAKVTAVEYLSNTCSHCARFDREVFPDIKKEYIDKGKVQYHIREFLTPP